MNKLEKINTIFLCDLMTHLGVASAIDPKIVKYAIESGNLWVLDAEYHFLSEESPSKEVRDLTVSILNMYRGLSKALWELPASTQDSLKKKYKLKIDGVAIQIPGFDGNNESEYFSVIEAFQAINRFPEQSSPIANTHSQSIYKYEKMLEIYNSLNPLDRSWKLSEEEVRSVLDCAPQHF